MRRAVPAALTAAILFVPAAAGARTLKINADGSEKTIIAVFTDDGKILKEVRIPEANNGYVDVDVTEEEYVKAFSANASGKITEAEIAETDAADGAEQNTDGTERNTDGGAEQETAARASVYPRGIDEAFAFCVVDSVVQAVNEENELCTQLHVFGAGREFTMEAEDGFCISTAPEAYSGLGGESVSVLARGDVINYTASLSGRIQTIDLIFRPADTNPVTSGADYGRAFAALYTSGGYVRNGKSTFSVWDYGSRVPDKYGYTFGVITNKKGKTFTLSDVSGRSGKMLDVDVADDTSVYVCDISDGKKVRAGRISDITKTYLPAAAFDGDGNIIDWSDDVSYNYAFVRTVEGTAADIVIYTNYND